jgi:hypothetical protein
MPKINLTSLLSWFRSPECRHEWRTVAYDGSFNTTYTDSNRVVYHKAKWQKCKHCDSKSFDIDGAINHRGIEHVRLVWQEQGRVHISKNGYVYDENYQQVFNGQTAKTDPGGFLMYEYQPVTGIRRLLDAVEADTEFVELAKNTLRLPLHSVSWKHWLHCMKVLTNRNPSRILTV